MTSTTTFNDCWCSLTIDSLETAPMPPKALQQLRRRASAEERADQYVLLRSNVIHYSRLGNVVRREEGLPTCYRRSKFFANPGPTICSTINEFSVTPAPWPEVLEYFLSLMDGIATRVAEDPSYVDAPVVPLVICILIKPAPPDDYERLTEEVGELSLAEAEAPVVPAEKSAVEALEEAKEYEGHDRCAVCLEEFGGPTIDDGKVLRMPCEHVYHKKCIVEWLERSHMCPLCRYPMPT